MRSPASCFSTIGVEAQLKTWPRLSKVGLWLVDCSASVRLCRNPQIRRETMKTLSLTIMATTMATGLAIAETVNFDDMKAGMPPPGWTATQTGSGSAKWSVEKDDSAPSKPNVLKQSGQATFHVCIKDDTSLKDGFVEVKFKPVAGKEDQAGGVIWRVQDANNYYIARANALEDNVTIYHTINGKRVEFKNINTKVTTSVWYTP